jgi:hypothetical protein
VRNIPIAALALLACAPLQAAQHTIVKDDFSSFDARRWVVEAEPASANGPTVSAAPRASAPSSKPPVYTQAHALVLNGTRGLTVWLRQRLNGHYEISYTRTVLDHGDPNDRVSDMNQFWLASASHAGHRKDDHAPPFGGSGRFTDYDSLTLYYVGVGGNDNTTTRFRHYDGTPSRPLLAEYTAPPWLLRANHAYRVRIVVDGRGTRFYLDGKPCFAAAGPLPDAGWFGFRSTASRQTIRDFAIRALP